MKLFRGLPLKRSLLPPIFLLLGLLLSLQAQGTDAPPVDPERSHVEQIRERGFLWVRCFPQQISPFLAVNTSMGAMPAKAGPDRFRGVDIDVLKRVAEHLGVELKIHPGDEPTILSSFDALEEGYGDVVAGGLTITESRLKRFSFSAGYFQFFDILLSGVDGEARKEGFNLHNSRLAIMPGSSFDEQIQSLEIPKERFNYFDFIGEAHESVAEGKHHFTFADSTMMRPEDLLGVEVAYRIGEQRNYGYVLPKSSDLKDAVDELLEKMRQNGELDRILQKHKAHGSLKVDEVPLIPWQSLAPESPSESSKMR